jgi:beta-lactamase class A
MTDPTVFFPYGRVKSTKIKSAKDDSPFVKAIVFFFILSCIILFIVIVKNDKASIKQEVVKKTNPSKETITPTLTPIPKPRDLTDLIKKITEITDKHEGMYSIRFENFKTPDAFGINEEVVVDAASVSKIAILASLYQQVDKGVIDLDKQITIAENDVQRYGTGSIYNQKPPYIYSIRDLGRLMMEVSDNTAAFVLSNRVIGRANVQEFCEKIGMKKTNITDNLTTNRDMATLMRAIFEGKVANEELTKEMIGWMDKSIFEDRLPLLLPKSATVYHKIGNQIRVIHDVGVIEFDDKQYYLGVLTTDVPDEAEARQAIGEISKTVYDFIDEH